MEDITRELFYACVRARDFGAANSADFAVNSMGDKNFKVLATNVPIVEASGALQESNIGKQATVSKTMAARDVREYLRKINRTARSMGVDHPEIAELFRMPHGSNLQKLIAAATTFHTDSEAHKELLIAYEMPADFRDVLLAKIDTLQSAVSESNAAKDSQVGATANIDAAMSEMGDALRRLRGIVPNVYEDNPEKLGAWTSASHVKRPAKKKTPPVNP